MADVEKPEQQVTAPPDVRDRPRIGVDEWVARGEERRAREPGLLGLVRDVGDRLPWWSVLAGAAAAAALVGALEHDSYVLQVGFDTLTFVLLALGLNIVVGWAGLLDLGYVAFLGIGAYGYAWLSSDHFDIHWPAELSVPPIVVGTAAIGLLVGLTSWRLLGDYLAIVTLFFLQIFITFANNGDSINVPFRDEPVNLTNGANGIHPLDSFNLFGWHAETIKDYYFLALGTVVILLAALYLLNESRTGRAWRALREDPLAANLLSIPVNRQKLLAFVFGAAVGGLTGTIFAASQAAVFPPDFNLQKLIIIYAMVILGGAGSLAGVVIGAIVVNVADQLLTTPENARLLFYGAIVLAFAAAASRRRWGPAWTSGLAAATIAFGFAVHAIASAAWPDSVAGTLTGGGFASALEHWVLVPEDPTTIGKYAYVLLVALVVAMAVVRLRWRRLLVVPAVYLAACVWENVLVADPSTTRLILLGALLVALMNLRPEGLLGTARVEIA